MVLDAAACHAAVRARDARFDGTFYTGVKTTGIYCRPICPARTPLPGNCSFFETAASAEAAGFRPCLRCRPELSPGTHDSSANLARQFLRDVQQDGLFGESLESAARRLGVSSRHLRRTMEDECGVSPLQLVRTTRLLFARRLLSATALPVSQVAFGSGFSSLGRFNHAFRAHYGITPSVFRKRTGKASRGEDTGSIRLALAYREPFHWESLLSFWTRRAIGGVETIAGGRYCRTVRMGAQRGWICAGPPSRGTLEVEVSSELAGQLLPLAGRIRACFDLDANPSPIAAALSSDPLLRARVERYPGLRVPGAFDGFELAVRAVLGQQVSVAAASTLAGRLVQRFAEAGGGLPAGLTHYPLEAAVLAQSTAEDIGAIGIPLARAQTLRALAIAATEGALDLGDSARAYAALGEIPGIGKWTQDYIAMRVLRWPDAFPAGDLGLRKALNPAAPLSAKELERTSQRWRPWRAYAALYLWTACSEDHR